MISRRSTRYDLTSLGLAAALAAAPAAAVDLTIFGDVTLVDSDAPDSHSSFVLGDVDFFVTQNINDRLTATLELDFHAHDGGEIEADVERLWIRYEASDAFQIAAGRFHTPLGYWNRTYHHGTLIQDTVDRPFFIDWEHDGGVLPMHVVGLMATSVTRWWPATARSCRRRPVSTRRPRTGRSSTPTTSAARAPARASARGCRSRATKAGRWGSSA